MISMYAEYSGRTLYVALSSDTIEGAKNGDTLYEMDTGKRYVYNESNDAWDEQPEEGGGGGGTLTTKTITTNGTFSAADDGADGFSEVTTEVYPYSHELTVTNNGPGDRQYAATICFTYTPAPGIPHIRNATLRGAGRTLETHIPAGLYQQTSIVISIQLDVTFVISNGGRVAISGIDSAYPTNRVYVITFPTPDSSDPQHYTITINPAS